MGDDMKNLAERYKKKLERQELDKKVFVQEQGLLKSGGAKRWSELRGVIEKKLDSFNQEMAYEALSWDEVHSERISITRKEDGLKLEGGYEAQSDTVFFKCQQANINSVFTLIVRDKDVVFASTKPHSTPVINTHEDIANGLIRKFLEE